MSISIRKISHLKDPRDRSLLSQFTLIYNNCFPDQNEREDPIQWENRLLDKDKNSEDPLFHIALLGKQLNEGISPTVYGGIVFEYYKKSACGLLTYIAIDRVWRGRGFAKNLLANAISMLQHDARKEGKILSAVFAEANDVCRTLKETDSMPPSDRLIILSRLGAKWINIEYVQPSLKKHQARVRNLLLLWFPSRSDNFGSISSDLVREFLSEFYLALGIPDYKLDPDFRKMMTCLKTKSIRLKELPAIEKPLFHFKKAAICLHIVSSPNKLWINSKADDMVDIKRSYLRSFELDLLTYRFQENPPFVSRCVTEYPRNVRIHYPESIEYDTEGRCVHLICSEMYRTKPARAFISYTDFLISGIRIWHITFQPPKDDNFTEYDLIKLTKLYGGIQEGNRLLENIFFSIENEPKTCSLSALINKLSGEKESFPVDLRAGTIEIDLSSDSSLNNISELLEKLRNATNGNRGAQRDLEEIFKKETSESQSLKALCGIVTGIFDFNRMEFLELIDTFDPSVIRGTSITRIHRGNLVGLDCEDEILKCCWNTTGISPYLIIPQAILVHNDTLVNYAEAKMLAVMGEVKHITKKKLRRNLNKWDEIRQEAERHLGLEYIPNIFQYSTEQQIMNDGLRLRGSTEKARIVHERLREMKQQIDSMRAIRTDRAETTISLLLAFLSGIAFQPLLFAFIDDWYGRIPSSSRLFSWVVFAIIFSGFLAFFAWTKRSAKRK